MHAINIVNSDSIMTIINISYCLQKNLKRNLKCKTDNFDSK